MTTTNIQPATEKQLAFLRKLVQERPSWATDQALDLVRHGPTLSKVEASRWIDAALKTPSEKPNPNRPVEELPDIKAGHYAIPSTYGTNDLDFYRVDRPTEGRWEGRTFVKMVVGGRPDARVARDAVPVVLFRIQEAGPEAAATRYGVEIGRCHVCNRSLTDETSRALGIGPECGGRR